MHESLQSALDFHEKISSIDSARSSWIGVGLASGKVAELVKGFEHVNEILEGLLILWSFRSVRALSRPEALARDFI